MLVNLSSNMTFKRFEEIAFKKLPMSSISCPGLKGIQGSWNHYCLVYYHFGVLISLSWKRFYLEGEQNLTLHTGD